LQGECNVCDHTGIVNLEIAHAAMASTSVSSVTDQEEYTLDSVREMSTAKRSSLKKEQLVKLVNSFIAHIDRLELDLEKNKAPINVNDDSELSTELRRLKEAVFLDATGANAHGDVPVGLTQEYWDTGNRLVIGWDAIHKLATEQNGTPEASNDVMVNAVANANATSVEEDNTSSKAKSVKLAKRVKLAKSTALWCLLPFTPLMQEAKDKPRKVCPVNLRGRSARPATAAANTRRSASWLTTARG
jgi:hypothetical protein